MQKTIRQLTVHEAIIEYLVAKRAERLSPNTLQSYTIILGQFERYIGSDPILDQLTTTDIRRFLGSLQEVKAKTVLNTHAVLSSLWTWAVTDGVCSEQILRRITPPRPDEPQVVPLTEAEVRKLIAAAESDERTMIKALIMLMIDTGVRASELTGLKIENLKGNVISVFGKGSKWRDIPISRRTMQALIVYLDQRGKVTLKSPLFPSIDETTDGNQHMSRYGLGKLVSRLGKKAGVTGVHPHLFRHTFATNYLKNGGDAISLQKLLGHTSLDMVKRYVNLACGDLREIHQRASPVENWRL